MEKGIDDLSIRRAAFVYEATRLLAIANNDAIVPEPWLNRHKGFRKQYVEVVRRCDPASGGSFFYALCEIAKQWIHNVQADQPAEWERRALKAEAALDNIRRAMPGDFAMVDDEDLYLEVEALVASRKCALSANKGKRGEVR